ncbi:DUF6525 family protein [Cereibacter sp. SYSU M97828]|nr:DUF6525 family protein [Cereibacter flavus]
MRNLRTTLARRARPDPMRRYDALPPDLRAWLQDAALPWSATSALRLWTRALAVSPADPARFLAAAEARSIARDAARIWGKDHPSISNRSIP